MIRARFGRKSPDACLPLAAVVFFAAPGTATGSIRSSMRAVQNVQQRHKDLEAEAFGSLDHQAVDLAGGQTRYPARPAGRTGQWWRTCPGSPSPGAGSSGSPVSAVIDRSLLSLGALGVERRGQRLAQRRVHEVVADMGVDRGRAVGLVAHLALEEPAVKSVLGEMADIRVPDRVGHQRLGQTQRVAVGDEAGVDLRRAHPAAALGHPQRRMIVTAEARPDVLHVVGHRVDRPVHDRSTLRRRGGWPRLALP